jgi:hypothetical protein
LTKSSLPLPRRAYKSRVLASIVASTAELDEPRSRNS